MRVDNREPAVPVGLDLAGLARFLTERVPGFGGTLRASIIHGGRSNLTYAVSDGASQWVVRRPPLGVVAPTANDIVREYRVVAALQSTPLPVPRPVALCEDASVIGAPFSVTGFVTGTVIRSPADAATLTYAQARACGIALVTALAQLHAVDPREVGLDRFGTPTGFVARQVTRWHRQWEAVATRPLPAIERLHARLTERVPPHSAVAVVHGDYRLDNTILALGDPARIEAIVDWEMATVGDPLTDLGLLLAYWDPVVAPLLADGHPTSGNPGFPDHEEVTERYLALAAADHDADLAFYRALAYFKLAVIAEGIHARHREGLTVGRNFETVASAVEPLVEAGLTVLSRAGGG